MAKLGGPSPSIEVLLLFPRAGRVQQPQRHLMVEVPRHLSYDGLNLGTAPPRCPTAAGKSQRYITECPALSDSCTLTLLSYFTPKYTHSKSPSALPRSDGQDSRPVSCRGSKHRLNLIATRSLGSCAPALRICCSPSAVFVPPLFPGTSGGLGTLNWRGIRG